MKKNHSIIVWGGIYLIVAIYQFTEFKIVRNLNENTYLFLEQSLFRVQKFMYNTSIIFTIYLFLLKRPFNSPMFVSRSREDFSKHVLLYGLKICFIYIVYTLIIYITIPLLFGTIIRVNSVVILNTAKLFTFIFSMYCMYLYFYLKTNQQILSIVSIYVFNFLILVIYFSIKSSWSYMPSIELELQILTILSSIIIILFVSLILFENKNKDFLI